MIREFTSYREILALDPGLKATAWAVLSHKTGALLDCGIVAPFAEVSKTKSMAELRSKIIRIWEDRVGYSKSPLALVVKLPQLYRQKTSTDDPDDLIPLSVMSGLLWASFNPKLCFLPKATTWNNEIHKDVMQERILEALKLNSKKVLAEKLHVVPKYQRQFIYDAIGIGLWAFKKLQGEAK